MMKSTSKMNLFFNNLHVIDLAIYLIFGFYNDIFGGIHDRDYYHPKYLW